MRKGLFLSVTVVSFFVSSLSVFAGTIPKVNVNGCKILVKDLPFNENGRTFIPLRSISENLGATVAWDAKTQTATITQEDTTIVQHVGSNTARVNNEIIELDAPVKIKNGVTYVPVRFVAEALGSEIKFDKPSNTLNIDYRFPTDGGQKYDAWGRPLRSSNLPKSAKDFSYILKGIPNEMYELKPIYAYRNKKVEGKDYIRPVNMATDESRYYSTENVQMWKSIVETNLDLKFNVDSKNIDNTWADKMAQTYMDSKPDTDSYYERNFNDTKKYVKYIKDNNIKIEGDFFVEPSICYRSSGTFYMRSWVKFKATSNKVNQVELYEKNPQKIKTNKWYVGYVDIGLGTNNGSSIGKDFGIVRDTITIY